MLNTNIDGGHGFIPSIFQNITVNVQLQFETVSKTYTSNGTYTINKPSNKDGIEKVNITIISVPSRMITFYSMVYYDSGNKYIFFEGFTYNDSRNPLSKTVEYPQCLIQWKENTTLNEYNVKVTRGVSGVSKTELVESYIYY